jgi:hypothetical protein
MSDQEKTPNRQLSPIVRHMLLCDDVQQSSSSSRKVNVLGLLSTIYVDRDSRFPIGFGCCVYVVLTEVRGPGAVRVAIRAAETERLCYLGTPHHVAFRSDPLRIYGLTVRIAHCQLPESGLYWVELRYNEVVLSREPILVLVR